MKHINILLTLILAAFMHSGPVLADHYEAVFAQHRQCTSSCESTQNAELAALPCNYQRTQNALSACQSRADNALRSCSSNCRSEKSDAKKICRNTKKMERRACRAAKKAEKEACKDLSGRAKRQCKKQARKEKRDCKKGAREEKRMCIDEANSAANSCLNDCQVTRQNACTQEQSAANTCATLARPIFDRGRQCKNSCDSVKDEGLTGYNNACPNNHGGSNGVQITFQNAQGQNLSLMNGGQLISLPYTVGLACNTQATYDFSDGVGSGYDHRTIIGPVACCETTREVTELVYVVN